MSYTIKNEDSIKYIRSLKENHKEPFIDSVITDPPYNISRNNNFKTIGRAGINFGNWDYGFDQTTWIKEISPLIKNGGSMIIFNDYKNFGQISKALEESGFHIKDLIRWIKNNPMPRNTQRRYVTDYEFAIWAVKGKGKWTFNKNKEKPYLRPEFKHPIVTSGKNKLHPTQKSLKLLKDLICVHTNKGDLIYDPFMGSGSTGVAAVSLNRIFMGSEISSIYFDKAEKWISESYSEKIKNKHVDRSPLYYLGDKYKLLPQIFSFFPNDISTFYDVFGGGGTMMSSIVSKKYVFNDINKNVCDLVKIMKNNSFSQIIKAIRKVITKYKLPYWKTNAKVGLYKDEYNRLKSFYNEMDDKDSFDGQIHLLVLVIYGFNSQIRFNSSGLFNIPPGKQMLTEKREQILRTFINSIKGKNVTFWNNSFERLLEINFKKNDFVYLDPPYSITNATYNSKWSDMDDEKLFRILDELDAKNINWALSNVTKSGTRVNARLIEWSKKYYVNKLNHNYNNSNYRKKEKGAQEVLITNYVKKRI